MADTIRSGILQGFSGLVEEFSVAPETLLQQCRIDSLVLEDEDDRIAIDSLVKLLDMAASVTHCEHFGLLLASKQKSSFAGLIGLLAESSIDLESALKKVIRYMRIHAQGIEWQLSVEGEFAYLKFIMNAAVSGKVKQSVDLSLCQCFQFVRGVTNNRWQPLQVCFHAEKPEDDWYYKHLFGVPIVFNSEFDGFIFKYTDLKLPMSGQDERVHLALTQYADILNRDQQEDFCSKIKRNIRKLLPEGQCSSQTIANLMACDKRTLQRNLKQQGVTYQQLLDEVRYSMAKEYLRDSTMPLTNLATMLGYTEVSAFSRAFKKQFGLAPSEWRKENK